ncbi:DnaA N-terminal domain-containing protein [Falsibacillus pallidus]|uniref:DnaA-like protein n=1 Tax=Falsibacillus pallidus TaxID=493781 RepID=A0A370GL90_9BACI|nr:DnaA N-terminal domain-containing protein [Falsibacillus pallidus]RDI44049.1 DnaA-like protein [Falsibacillus pallidus]
MENKRINLVTEISLLKDIFYTLDEIIEQKEEELQYLTDIANHSNNSDGFHEDDDYNRFIQRTWYDIRELLKDQMTSVDFEIWIEHLTIQAIVENKAFINVPNQFAVHWIRRQFARLITDNFSTILHDDIEVKLLCEDAG